MLQFGVSSGAVQLLKLLVCTCGQLRRWQGGHLGRRRVGWSCWANPGHQAPNPAGLVLLKHKTRT